MADDKNNSTENNKGAGDKPSAKPAKAAKKSGEKLTDRASKWLIAKKNEYLAEFKRIVWPTREVLLKQTLTVIVVSLIFGVYIAILDGAFGFLFTQFTKLTSTLFS